MGDDSMGYWISEASRLTSDSMWKKEERDEKIESITRCGTLDKYVVCYGNI